jgi:hypothetical protein
MLKDQAVYGPTLTQMFTVLGKWEKKKKDQIHSQGLKALSKLKAPSRAVPMGTPLQWGLQL